MNSHRFEDTVEPRFSETWPTDLRYMAVCVKYILWFTTLIIFFIYRRLYRKCPAQYKKSPCYSSFQLSVLFPVLSCSDKRVPTVNHLKSSLFIFQAAGSTWSRYCIRLLTKKCKTSSLKPCFHLPTSSVFKMFNLFFW